MKIKFLILFFFFSIAFVFGQRKKVENLPKFDSRRIHFGFTLAVNYTDFVIRFADDFKNFDSLRIIESEKQPGFNLGIITDLHLHPNLNLRFLPSLVIASRNLEYSFAPKDSMVKKTAKTESTFLLFPLNLKYRSARVNNFAAYILGGGSYSYDLSSQKDVQGSTGSDIIIKLARDDIYYEVGVGFDFFLQYFKFSPELKFSFGTKNILINDNTIFTNPIQQLNSKVFLISFHFEG